MVFNNVKIESNKLVIVKKSFCYKKVKIYMNSYKDLHE